MKKRKDGRYQKKLTLQNGKQKTVYGKSIAELNQAVQEVQAQERNGILIDDATLVGEWAKIWMDTYKSKLRANTVSIYRFTYNNYIMPVIGNMLVKDVRPVHVQQIMLSCAEKSESLQRKVIMTLQQIFTTARHNHLIAGNPCEGIKITKHTNPEKIKYLTLEQQETLMEAVTDPTARVFCGLCLYCGLRREEALGLQWSDIQNNKLTVNRAITFIGSQVDPIHELKTKAAHRTIPMPDPMLQILSETPRLNLPVITNGDGNQITHSGFNNMWAKVKKSVDFPVHPHMLRHTYATSLCLAGVDLKRAQYLLGHSSIQMTANIYTHMNASEAEKSVDKLNDYFLKSSQKVVKL